MLSVSQQTSTVSPVSSYETYHFALPPPTVGGKPFATIVGSHHGDTKRPITTADGSSHEPPNHRKAMDLSSCERWQPATVMMVRNIA